MSGAMRIASVCRELPTPDQPLAGLFVLRRLQAMRRLADVRIIQPIPHFPFLRRLPPWACAPDHEADGTPITHAGMFYLPKYLKSLDGHWLRWSVARPLRSLVAQGGIDAVDAHFGYPEGVGCYLAARRLGLPVFITLRGLEADYLSMNGIAPQLIHAMRNADGCICVSRALKTLAVGAGVSAEKVRVIPNAVDRQLFRPGSREAARERLGLGQGEPIIVSVANLLSVKRHEISIRAFAGVRSRFPNARLVLVGGRKHEADYPRRLQEQAEASGVTSSVRFAGGLPPHEVADWLRAADVFALASRREGCCNAVLEALATGLPVVATPAGDNPHFVRDGENGYIVPFDDSAAMAEGLARALERSDWDRDAISKALTVGDWDRVATDVLDFFRTRMPQAVRGPAERAAASWRRGYRS